MNSGLKIIGTGCYVPPLCVTNEDYSKYVETDDEWIRTRTGISERRLNIGKSNHFMAIEAAKDALESSGINADEIDCIIVTTCTPDYLYPIISCIVQEAIGAVNASCFDLNAACTGFITALDIARSHLALGDYKKILIISSETLNTHVDFTDRASCVLFGDGAGAVLLEASDKPYASFLGAVGEKPENASLYFRINYNKNSPFPSLFPEDEQFNDTRESKIVMEGKSVYKFAVDAMPKAVNGALLKAGLKIEDIDLFIPHQANIRIIKTAVQTLGLSMDKVYTNIALKGNTSSACIPTCLAELNKDGKLKSGMKICLVGFGAGLTYGSACFEI